MLRATAFPAPYNSVPVLTRAPTCDSFAPSLAVHSHASFISRFEFRQFLQLRANLRAVRGGGFVAAAGKKKWRGGAGLEVVDDEFDDEVMEDDNVGDEYDYDDDEEEEDGEDDEALLPLEKMKKWFQEKPKGFGQGKVYDTSVEDKLLEELRQSREAQAENLKKLKSNPVKPSSNKSDPKKKDAELVPMIPIGSRVRLVNLPKKRNIHRDLKSALQGIPGIMNIVPAVSGNKKTRDPVCKGFAFVDFKREEDAVRFAELYSGQTITFGKIQKQIKCELLNAQSSTSSLELSKNLGAPRLRVLASEENSNEGSNINDSAFNSWDGMNSDDLDDLDNQIYDEEQESDGENEECATALKMDGDDSVEMRDDSEINSLPSEELNRNPTTEQKTSSKVKQEKARKKKVPSKGKPKNVLDVPGSAKRLKVKEKAVLSDVFSKYGSKAALTSKES